MTLLEAVTKLQTRFAVDADAEIDVTSQEVLASAIMDAAEKVSEHSYALWTSYAPLTLVTCVNGASAGAEPSLFESLSSQVIPITGTGPTAFPIFHIYGISINGAWLTEYEPTEFFQLYQDYATVLATSYPGSYCKIAPSKVRLYPPPNAAAAASTCYARGFYRHPRYLFADHSTLPLLMPDEFHELVVDRAYLDNSKSYAAGEGLERRASIEKDYLAKTSEYRQRQLELYKPSTRRDGAGRRRRMIYIGYAQ